MRRRLARTDFAGQNRRGMYPTLKYVHVGFAILTISGFLLRGFWMLTRDGKLDRLIVRVLPHLVDTAFLITGIWLVLLLRLKLTNQAWLIAKLAALGLYVVLGAIALRRGPTMRIRALAFVAACACFAYIVGVALNKTPLSWLADL
jgi:uncharacterized membrane protein SirB2